MSRSPLSYPLSRAADTDVGGAADLQTDIMRFMAILSLCLVAIFALVQSIPLAPVEPAAPVEPPPAVVEQVKAPAPEPEPVMQRIERPAAQPVPRENPVELTRPKWVSTFTPAEKPIPASEPAVAAPAPPVAEVPPAPAEPVAVAAEQEGFTLRFASDAALTRAVAAHHVGLYALESGRAKRMTVSESRISFWDASTPNAFHEMEAHTVPVAVIRALARTGVETSAVDWGVTLPGKMTSQLEALMREHRGGSLIIDASGDIRWEAS